MRYVIPGNPIPLQRVRFGGGRCWDEQKKVKVGLQVILDGLHGANPMYSGPLQLEIIFYFKFPQAVSQKKKDEMREKGHSNKPDLSNLIKFYEDIATGILYEDDRLISDIIARKRWDDVPRTEFVITEIR